MHTAPSSRPVLPRGLADIPRTFEWFAAMRATRPVAFVSQMRPAAWQVFGYDDVTTVLTDHSRFSSQALAAADPGLADTLVTANPPDHGKLRSLVSSAFTPRVVSVLSERIAAIAQELLEGVRARGEMDVVTDFAFPLPARVIAELLGVPEDDWDVFSRMAATSSGGGVDHEIRPYFSGLLETRRSQPRDDLVSALSTAEIDGMRLSERELVSFCHLLVAAGQETTKNLIANFILMLADHPPAQAELVRDPGLVPGAIEEVLRCLPPVWSLLRQTTCDVDLNDVAIPAGELVMPWIVSANRDASEFPEPERFDVRRDPNRHLSFGHGIHFCLGAPLARLEARVALPMMLAQLRDLRLVQRESIGIRAGIVFAANTVPVTFATG